MSWLYACFCFIQSILKKVFTPFATINMCFAATFWHKAFEQGT